MSQERRAQVEAYDSLTHAADRVLRDAQVQQRLGDIATDLLNINCGTFLPNIRGGTVSIPWSKRRTDAVAVIPLAGSGIHGPLSMGPSMVQPTPNMRKRVVERMTSQEMTRHQAKKFIRGAVKDTDYPLYHDPDLRRAGYLDNYAEIHQPTRTVLRSRSTIFTYLPSSMYTWQDQGAIMAHEYVHILQAESKCQVPEDQISELASDELQAYYVEAQIRRGMLGQDHPVRDGNNSGQVCFAVEGLRARLNMDNDPFAAPAHLIKIMDRLGVLSESAAHLRDV
jgi:hypothetical protein